MCISFFYNLVVFYRILTILCNAQHICKFHYILRMCLDFSKDIVYEKGNIPSRCCSLFFRPLSSCPQFVSRKFEYWMWGQSVRQTQWLQTWISKPHIRWQYNGRRKIISNPLRKYIRKLHREWMKRRNISTLILNQLKCVV